MPKLTGAATVFGSDWNANDATAVFPLGTIGQDGDGFRYVYVQNGEAATAFARGKVAMMEAVVDVDTVSSSTDLLEITEAAAGWTAGAYSGYFVYVNDGTGEGQLRKIKGNNTTTLFLETALTSALAVGTSDIQIFNPFVVNVATASGQTIPIGVATGAITAAYCGWLQISGLAEVLAGGVVEANKLARVGDDTAGQIVTTADGNDVYDVNTIGWAIAANTNADVGTPIWLNI